MLICFCSTSSSNYPVKLKDTSDVGVGNMNLMIKAEGQKKVLVRGYSLDDQLRIRQNCEENVDGSLNVCLSQDTEQMFKNDISFIEELQEEQKTVP